MAYTARRRVVVYDLENGMCVVPFLRDNTRGVGGRWASLLLTRVQADLQNHPCHFAAASQPVVLQSGAHRTR